MLDRDAYDRYVAAFNAKDYDAVADFYVDPPLMTFFGVEIRSRAALKDFYAFLHDHVIESVRVLNFAASETLTAIDAVIRVEAVKDLTREALDARGLTGFFPIAAGDVQEMRQFIFYTMQNAKIARVECALA
ncbi:nuclear transport factor 2 family protein [Novosphingobium sp. SL115]|uniref:ketosteroid isomerase family protein n=1 Tax=Novosphingobium sp. SL115 TaxID=2995150 RepID=UPI00227504CA|nr:ketosteroid isomerase family protein [Novosphingobium sp. SL115]MCY1669781.1 nuclear transport factor 2 family protein [Novosphingobium sp. SL115]